MDKNYADRRWFTVTVAVLVGLLAALACLCIYIDPFIHYHKPLNGYAYYSVKNEAYVNDGIIRKYDFTGIITGTSMSENFNTSQAEQLFGGSFIKIPLAGTTFCEVSDQLSRVYARGKNPEIVIRSLDPDLFIMDKDKSYHDYSDIRYIYNDNPFDDIKYLFNLDVFADYTLEILRNRLPDGQPGMDFDKYCAWECQTGKDIILSKYIEGPKAKEEKVFTEYDKKITLENVCQNLTSVADDHPETTFFYFISPYSIFYWKNLNDDKSIKRNIEAEKIAVEEMLRHPNIKLFAFSDNFDLICDLNNYKDYRHYTPEINSLILKWMSEGKNLLSPDNYHAYFDKLDRFYSSYDYSELMQTGD